MSDLADRLKALDQNSVPDVWDEVRQRSEEIQRGRRPPGHRGGRWTPLIAAIVALAVAAAAIAFLAIAFRGVDHARPAAPTPQNGVIVYTASTRLTDSYRS